MELVHREFRRRGSSQASLWTTEQSYWPSCKESHSTCSCLGNTGLEYSAIGLLLWQMTYLVQRQVCRDLRRGSWQADGLHCKACAPFGLLGLSVGSRKAPDATAVHANSGSFATPYSVSQDDRAQLVAPWTRMHCYQ
ncbi:hypothetical protein DOTSEDRAFT_73972 [Dothistroma septosporum NZE10]|uniref:Uncharacterized protein n=1 Tax=Dothistroma septosporum (strain NZE10 / CBS 128990) TaxID=675120 RepID=N1PHC3_DOTSN|nr:hypothetical protein DOTSEDRAFT_73972 [Dothistroma septosporum NZE10]